jgi:tRNA nucleotidyltransferase/poly(A) polymerase
LFLINFKKGFSKETVTARFVGGCVRKHLSNDEIDDIDIATILSLTRLKKN